MGKSLENINSPIKIFRFTLPTMLMMVFLSFYTMVDGIFVANYVGEDALAAMNISYPVMSAIIAIGVMLGMGGSAIVAKNIGEGKLEVARRRFSLIVAFGFGIGTILIPLGLYFIEDIVYALGATDMLAEYCRSYLLIIIAFAPVLMLQLLFQSFFITAGKPKIGLWSIVAGGITNIVLDYIFIVRLDMGVSGAALATSIGFSIPAVIGMIHFFSGKNHTLHFTIPKMEIRVVLEASMNGMSEMVTNLAVSVTTLLFNFMMLKFFREDGVAAITIALYLQFLLTSAYMGYSMGILPVVSYNHGKRDFQSLKAIFRISLIFIFLNSILWFGISVLFKNQMIGIFVDRGSKAFRIARDGWTLFALSFLICGFNIFASSLFTALSDGKRSAIISLMRTFVFLSLSIIFLPRVLGYRGIWLSVALAEVLTLLISGIFVYVYKEKYRYL